VFMSISPWETGAGKRARFGSAQAILRGGEPLQLQLSKGFFACNRAEPPVVGQGDGRFTNGVMME
jgi:hypothetical protein